VSAERANGRSLGAGGLLAEDWALLVRGKEPHGRRLDDWVLYARQDRYGAAATSYSATLANSS